jgi:hypothetical protein
MTSVAIILLFSVKYLPTDGRICCNMQKNYHILSIIISNYSVVDEEVIISVLVLIIDF